MYTLSESQVTTIKSDVKKAQITFSHLASELIDHICCEVEMAMWEGKSFEEAYEMVKQQTGISVLKKIQENTHYLIDKNYRIMKMTMKITGNVSLAMLGFGTIMKLVHWPGASVILVLGFFLLCFVFFPSAIYTTYKESKASASKLLHISIFLGGVLFMLGVLFKVMHWPGAGVLLLIGWAFILLLFLPVLLLTKRKELTTKRERANILFGVIGLMIFELSTMFKIFHWPGAAVLMLVGSIILITLFLPFFTYYNFKKAGKITGQFIFIITGSIFFILFNTLLALNVSTDILGISVREVEKSLAVVDYLHQTNDKLYQEIKMLPDSSAIKAEKKLQPIHESSQKICDLIESVKVYIIMTADDVSKERATELTTQTLNIKKKSNMDVVNHAMIGENCNGFAFNLKKDIETYSDNIAALELSNPEVKLAISNLLNTSDVEINNQKVTWENLNFGQSNVISALVVLTDIEQRVLKSEMQVARDILNGSK